MTDVLALPESERDKLAAVHVMGWRRIERSTYGGKVTAWYDDANKMEINHPHFDFRPSRDANDDYLILQKVRGEWDVSDRVAFGAAIDAEIWAGRERIDSMGYLDYEPGDYRDAALLVLAEKGEI